VPDDVEEESSVGDVVGCASTVGCFTSSLVGLSLLDKLGLLVDKDEGAEGM